MPSCLPTPCVGKAMTLDELSAWIWRLACGSLSVPKLQLAWMAFGRSHNHQNTRKKRSLDGETDEDGVSLSLERSSSHLEEASG